MDWLHPFNSCSHPKFPRHGRETIKIWKKNLCKLQNKEECPPYARGGKSRISAKTASSGPPASWGMQAEEPKLVWVVMRAALNTASQDKLCQVKIWASPWGVKGESWSVLPEAMGYAVPTNTHRHLHVFTPCMWVHVYMHIWKGQRTMLSIFP